MIDGISGTDNVSVMFPEKPSAVPLPPQPEILAILDELGLEAASGKITGLIIIGFRQGAASKASITGKISFSDGVAALEQMKFGILARDYSNTIMAQQPK